MICSQTVIIWLLLFMFIMAMPECLSYSQGCPVLSTAQTQPKREAPEALTKKQKYKTPISPRGQ